MIRTIYHGSKDIIKQPIYGYGKVYNDYGLGFYCTDVLDMAKEWGVEQNRNGYANQYEIICDDLKILDLNDDMYNILHWLAILLKNRSFNVSTPLAIEAKEYLLEHFLVDYSAYDIMVGYRADDSYFSFAQDFINGAISLRQINNALYLGKLGQQFVLKSKKAFDAIRFLGYEVATCEEWFVKKERRDKLARREYFDIERNRRKKGDIYITHILDEEMMPNDPRIRHIIS